MNYVREVKIDKTLADSYIHYKKKKGILALSKKDYLKIIYLINNKISKAIIENSLEFKMPYRLGLLCVNKNKLKINIKDGKILKHKMVVDWEASWKMWHEEYPELTHNEIKHLKGKQVVYQTNDHTNGYIMCWKWNKDSSMFRNKSVYSFKPTKQNRLNLGKWIKSEDRTNDYYLQNTRRYEGNRS